MRLGTLQCILATTCYVAVGLFFEIRSFASDAVWPDYEPVQLQMIALPGEVTGAGFVWDRSGTPRFMACVAHKLMTWRGNQLAIPNPHSGSEKVDRVLALRKPIGRTAFVGYGLTGKDLLFFDDQGALVAKKPLSNAGIDSLAIEGNRMLIDFGPGGGMRMYQFRNDGTDGELSEVWFDSEFGGWCVTLADFRNGYVAAAAEMGGEIKFLSADGKRTSSRALNFPMSVEAFPLSKDHSLLVSIDEPVDEPEELLFLSPDRILFRQLIGKDDLDLNWRLRRLVVGRLIDEQTATIAVLRGDGSVVIYDSAGKPQSMLPSVASRRAIELGPPHQGRDTLLSCEDRSLRQFAFPKAMPAQIAQERTTIKNPNAELLKIGDHDTAEDLWARAIWLGIDKATSSEVATLYVAALSRTKNKAPIYVSFGDAASGPTVLREMFDRTFANLNDKIVSDLTGTAKQIAAKPELKPDETATLIKQTLQNSYKSFATDDKSNGLESIGKLLTEGSDASEMYYLAAVAEDPNYLPAWFRLAKWSKGELRQRALRELARLDPDNALPHYLQAAIDVQQKDLAAALKSVQTGNCKTLFRTYDTPRPTGFKLHYPDSEFSREFGVVGKPIPQAALDSLAYQIERLFAWNDPVTHGIRRVYDDLAKEGARLRALGQIQSAIDVLEAVDEMCVHLMKSQPYGFETMGLGLYRRRSFYNELAEAYEFMGDGVKGQRFQEAEEMRLRLFANASKVLDEWTADSTDVKSILHGQFDIRQNERSRLEKALIESGFIVPPPASKK